MSDITDSCPPQTTLLALLEGRLEYSKEQALTEHLEHCDQCQLSMDQLAGGGPDTLVNVGEVLKRRQNPDPVSVQSESFDIEGIYRSSPKMSDWRSVLTPPGQGQDPGVIGLLGRFEVLEHIATGGMGIVFKGCDPSTERHIAIKVLAPTWAANPTSRQRFLREARSVAALDHENVLPIYTVEDEGRYPFIVMPFNDGETLEQRVRRDGPLPFTVIDEIGLAMARGLAAAHDQGIVHRDLKPANILIRQSDDHVRIADFGLARAADTPQLTVPGTMPGTPQFMAPEQINGKEVDHRADLFAFGSLLFYMATGEAPFDDQRISQILHRVTEEAPRKITRKQPPWFRSLLSDLLEKDPNKRLSSASLLIDRLQEKKGPTWNRRAVLTTLGVVGAGGVGVLIGQKGQAPRLPAEVMNTRTGERFTGPHKAVAQSQPNDILELRGHFHCNSSILIPPGHPLHFRAAEGERVRIEIQGNSHCLFTMSSLRFEGVTLARTQPLERGTNMGILPAIVMAKQIEQLHFHNCRFEIPWRSDIIADLQSCCLELNAVGLCEIDQCQFFGFSAAAIGVNGTFFLSKGMESTTVNLRDTLIVAESLITWRSAPDPHALHVTAERLAVVSEYGIRGTGGRERPQPDRLSVSMGASVMDVQHDLVTIDELRQLRDRLQWESQHCQIGYGGAFLVIPEHQQRADNRTRFASLDQVKDAGFAFADQGSSMVQAASETATKLRALPVRSLNPALVEETLPHGWQLPFDH